ncbi:MAG: hypothetical protein ACTSVU_04030 [Promethearchaeota archaeon]
MITAYPKQFITQQLLKYFRRSNINFHVISPYLPFQEYSKIFSSPDTKIVLIKPDDPCAYKINEIAKKLHCRVINQPEIMNQARDRCSWEKEVMQLSRINKNKNFNAIQFPKNYTNLNEIREDFFPLLVKYPWNHHWYRFISEISNIEEGIHLQQEFPEEKLIFQEKIRTSENYSIKCYFIGDKVISSKVPLGKNILKPDLISKKQNLERSAAKIEAIISPKIISERIPTPRILFDFAQFLRDEVGIEYFNFDAVMDEDGQFVVVDINDFPGCGGILQCGEIFGQYITKCYNQIS